MDSISWAVSSDNGKKGFRGRWDVIDDRNSAKVWAVDEVIGLALDIDNGKMYLVRENESKFGRPVFNNVRFSLEGGDRIFPAISCSGGCELEYICEERKGFQPPDGYEFVYSGQSQETSEIERQNKDYIEKYYTLKVDHHQILLEFDKETKEKYLDLSPEVFNDQTRFKELLCEACDICSQLQNKQATILMMSEANAPEWLCTELSKQEPGEFRVHLGNKFLQDNCGMTWHDVLFPLCNNPDSTKSKITSTLRKKFRNLSIPLELPVNLAKYMWFSIICHCQHDEIGGTVINVKIGGRTLKIDSINGTLVLNPLQDASKLVLASYESVVTGFVVAASEYMREFNSEFKLFKDEILRSLDIRGHQYSKKGILDLVKAASQVHTLKNFNGFSLEIAGSDQAIMAAYAGLELSITEYAVGPVTIVFNANYSQDEIPIFTDMFSFRKQNQICKLKDVCEDLMLDSQEEPDMDEYYNILGLFMASRLEALQLKSLDLDISEILLNTSLMKKLINNPELGFKSGKVFNHLKHLSLKFGFICDQEPKGLDEFLCILGSLHELTSLDLSNGISLGNITSTVPTLLSELTKLTNLEKLKLRETELGQDQKAWEIVAATFTQLTSLTLLDLSDNWLGKIKAIDLINNFTRLADLTELKLCNNDIKSNECVELAKALANKVKSSNEEGAPGSKFSLSTLWLLKGNPIDQEEKAQLRKTVEDSKLSKIFDLK